MTSSTSSNGKVSDSDMLKRHRELIAEYDVKVGAPKAAVATKLGNLELDMELAGVEFEEWTKPSAYVTGYDMSEAELIEAIHGLRVIKDNPQKSDRMRSRAETRLEKYEAQAAARGVSVPEDAA